MTAGVVVPVSVVGCSLFTEGLTELSLDGDEDLEVDVDEKVFDDELEGEEG